MWLERGIGRSAYLAAGLLLFAVKIVIDIAVAHAFSRPYSILFYVSRSASPLFHPAENPSYWIAMWAIALPFIAVGLILTIRRLRDAGLSTWLALLFFVPFGNIMFFGFCALVPGAGAGTERNRRPAGGAVRMSYAHAAAKAGLFGAVIGLCTMAVAVSVFKAYGGALFIGAPAVSGFVSGILFSRWHRPFIGGAILSAILSLLIAGAIVIVFALEGLLCIAMSLPLVLLGSILGAAIGCQVERSERGGGVAPTAAALTMLPIALILESLGSPIPAEFPPVESSIVVNAPAEIVWRNVIAFPPLPAPSEWIFRAGVAAPLSATIDGVGVGAVRRCNFTTGSFVEPIENWEPPRELTFSVTSSPDPMREWTLWDGPRPPHLDGYLESVRGQFVLEPLPGGRTRLVGRTWYRTNMVPEAYWRLWADPIIHAIHMRVLRHVASLSEEALRQGRLNGRSHAEARTTAKRVARSRSRVHR
jgi:uncharacterized membrane protein YhaH (DUF805 family)